MMKKAYKKMNHLVGVLLLILSLIFLLPALRIVAELSGDSLPVYNGSVNVPGTQWYFGEKGTQLHLVNVMEKQYMEPQKTYVLSSKINYDGKLDSYPSVTFAASNCGVKVYYEEELIFQRMREDMRLPTNESLGLLLFSVPLGYDCQGKELRLELDPMIKTGRCTTLPDVQFGDYSTMMREMYIEGLPSLIGIAAMIFLGVALLAVGSVHEDMRKKCLNLSLFSVAFSVYLLTENCFVLHTMKSPYLAYLCNYFILALLPIFLLQAYKGRFSRPFQRNISIIRNICLIDLAAQILLHFTGVLDAQRMVPATQLCALLSILAMFIPIVVERKRPIVRRVTVEIMPFMIGALLDALYYFKETNSGRVWSSMGHCTSIGFLITLMVVIYEIRKTAERAAEESLKSRFFQEIAYKDALTGVNNRAAFDEEVREITAGKRPYRTLLCVAADLNGLKQVNDTYGHQEGDELIRRCAVLLETCFKSCGRVFRVGGDEFNIFVYDVDETDWPLLKKYFDEQRVKQNENESFPLSVAIGCAAVIDREVERALQLADERMYQDKCAAASRRKPMTQDSE